MTNMTHQVILRKAIDKAKKVGWDGHSLMKRWDIGASTAKDFYFLIIFDHDFAKAFWGEPKMTKSNDKRFLSLGTITYGWQYHLQQMVLEDYPIRYLEKFL